MRSPLELLFENENIDFTKYKNLEKYIRDNKNIQKYFEANFFGIKPKNYCGFLSLQNKDYFIVPKIALKDEENLNIFIYMLIYAYDIKVFNESISSSKNIKFKCLDIFIRYFSNTLIEELKKGVYKSYTSKEESSKVLKGKYLFEKNFSNFFNQNICCEFDEFTINNQLNRFFLYAIKTFMKYTNYQNLHKCELILDDVDSIHIDINRLNIEFNRLNNRFKKSFDIAILILNRLSPLVNNSNEKSFSFLFDMSEVFEKFIARLYKNIDSSSISQVQKIYGNLLLKPDIIFQNKIIDTKYKIVKDIEDLKTSDKYQMFTYGINFKIRDTMLLYPKHIYEISKNLKLGKDEDMVNLKLKSIDLYSNNDTFEFYINDIKEKLERII